MQRIMLKAVKVPVVVDQTTDTEVYVRTSTDTSVVLGIGMEPYPNVSMRLTPMEAVELAKMLLAAATEPPPF